MFKRKTLSFCFIMVFLLFWQKPVSLTNHKAEIPRETYNYQPGRNYLIILSWNIYMLPGCQLYTSGSERAEEIVKALKNSKYDIIVFQEAFDSQIRRYLQKELSDIFPFDYGPANNYSSLLLNSGLWVISKFPLFNIQEFSFKKSFGIERIARKGGLLVEGIFNNKNFQLAATHLQATGDQEIRQAQISELNNKLLKSHNINMHPQIICGDFNTAEDHTRDYSSMLRDLEARCGIWTGESHITYDLDNPLTYGVDYSQTIDFILYKDQRKTIKQMELKVQKFDYQDGYKKSFMSDHYAVEARVEFNEALTAGL